MNFPYKIHWPIVSSVCLSFEKYKQFYLLTLAGEISWFSSIGIKEFPTAIVTARAQAFQAFVG